MFFARVIRPPDSWCHSLAHPHTADMHVAPSNCAIAASSGGRQNRTRTFIISSHLAVGRLSLQSTSMVRMRGGAALAGIACLSTWDDVNSMTMKMDGRRSRYFAVQQTLPPLPRHMPAFANHTETLPYSSSHGKSIPVWYTNHPGVVSDWLSENIPNSNGILGFDVESVPTAPWVQKKASFGGPATVQLATTESCLVVHLTRRNGRPSKACAPILEAILADASIVKAGTGIDQDVMELWDCWRGTLHARSRLDIGGIGSNRHETTGLQRLAKSILGVNLQKSKKHALSDWSQVPLTEAQLIYSARDAWSGAAIVSQLADADPDTFGTEALIDLLKHETPMQELIERVQSRKRAKATLASILKPYKARKLRRVEPVPFPPKIHKRVVQLKNVLAETTMDKPKIFDVEPLGFKIYPP